MGWFNHQLVVELVNVFFVDADNTYPNYSHLGKRKNILQSWGLDIPGKFPGGYLFLCVYIPF